MARLRTVPLDLAPRRVAPVLVALLVAAGVRAQDAGSTVTVTGRALGTLKQRLKHGSGLAGEELHESRIAISVPSDQLLAVNDALAALALEDPQAAEVVEMRYFVGMSVPEIVDALNLAPRTVDRHWACARARLKRMIRASLAGPPGPA